MRNKVNVGVGGMEVEKGWGRANITIVMRLEVEYSPSNGANANVVHRDLDTYFQGHIISGNL